MDEGNVLAFWNPEEVGAEDSLTELLRAGAQRLLQQAVEAELEDMLTGYSDRRDAAGRQAVVRNGHLPAREILTGIGPVPVRVPKVRSRIEESVVFRSALVPPYVRKAKSVEAALPWLYLASTAVCVGGHRRERTWREALSCH